MIVHFVRYPVVVQILFYRLSLSLVGNIDFYLGTIPGPVAMGRTFDSNCNHWREGCNGPENCLIYDNSNLRKENPKIYSE